MALLVGAAVVLGGCGGDGGGSTAATTRPATAPATQPATEPATTTPTVIAATTAGATSTTTVDDVGAITDAFTVFFDGTVLDVERKVELLQDGDRYREMLTDTAADPIARTLSTRVRSVTILDATACPEATGVDACARVVHDLLVGGLPAFAAHESTAVRVDGRWRVAADSWCEIVVIGGAACPSTE